MLTDPIQIEKYFIEIENALLKKNKPLSEFKDSNTRSIRAGVYFIFDKGKLCYVGESGNVYARLSDLHKTFNHTFRRHLGEVLFSKRSDYTKATSQKKYCSVIEFELDEYYLKNLTFSAVSVSIGRKEFEEWILDKYPSLEFHNKRKKRK